MRILFALGCGALAAAACGNAVTSQASAAGAGGSAAATVGPTTTSASASASASSSGGGAGPTVVWGPCEKDYEQDCALVDLPLDWIDPAGKTIKVHISRKLAKTPASKAVWLLSGGPGQGANIWTSTIDKLQELDPDLDVYALEHRGTGLSTRLSCPDQEKKGSAGGTEITAAEWPACIQYLKTTWGDGLGSFNTTNAARDLGNLIPATRAPNQKTFVYGGSYGSLWAHRYLALFSDQPAGVILDGIFTPGAQWLSDYDKQYDKQAKKLAALCDNDALCKSKLGGDTWAAIGQTYTELAQGHCSALGLDKSSLQQVLAYLLDGWRAREFIPPLIYRLHRCDVGDRAAIANFFNVLFGKQQPADTAFSLELQDNISFSELWSAPPAPTADALQKIVDAAYFAPGLGPIDAPVEAIWPKYPPDPDFAFWALTDAPMLMMNGTLDTRTTIETAQMIAGHYAEKYETFVSIPNAAHTAGSQSPVKTMGAPPCGLQMFSSFMKDPKAPIDQACLNDLLAPSFTGTPATSMKYWGVPDMWENAMALKAPDGEAIDIRPPASVVPRIPHFH